MNISSDSATLAREISSLESLSESLDSWLSFWIILVVLGLIVEVWVEVKDHFEITHSDRPNIRKLGLTLVGPILITMGVAGELGIHFKARKVNTSLRDANSMKSALLNAEAGEARKKAGEAEERAGNAYRRASEADKQASLANERAADLEKEAADLRLKQEGLQLTTERLRKEYTTAKVALEKEKRDRLELEFDLSDRVFQEQLMSADVLSSFSGTPVFIEYLNDGECLQTAEQINWVLCQARWSTSGSTGGQNSIFFEGVTVSVGSKEFVALAPRTDLRAIRDLMDKDSTSSSIADALVTQLNVHGISTKRHAGDERLPVGTLVVRIGRKPNPFDRRRASDDSTTGLRVSGNKQALRAPIPSIPE